jgi:hypothetical protein
MQENQNVNNREPRSTDAWDPHSTLKKDKKKKKNKKIKKKPKFYPYVGVQIGE